MPSSSTFTEAPLSPTAPILPPVSDQANRRVTHCRNCGSPDVRAFCPDCGQENTHQIVPFHELFEDAFNEFFKVDAKLFVTLRQLLRRPGFLTQEYLAGRRTPYLVPSKLFFLLSAIYFIVFSLSGSDQRMRQMMENSNALMGGSVTATSPVAPTAKAGQPSVAPATPSKKVKQLEQLRSKTHQGSEWILDHLPTLLALLVPLYALILQGLDRGKNRRKRFYVEHLVFMTHFQSFSLILGIAFAPLSVYTAKFAGGSNIQMACAYLIEIIYLAIALRRVYGTDSWLKAGAKGFVLILAQVLASAFLGAFFMVFYLLL